MEGAQYNNFAHQFLDYINSLAQNLLSHLVGKGESAQIPKNRRMEDEENEKGSAQNRDSQFA